jgi:hypothetical protein
MHSVESQFWTFPCIGINSRKNEGAQEGRGEGIIRRLVKKKRDKFA